VDSVEFSAELWIWDARGEESWTFISVPLEASEEIRAFSAMRPRAGFGSVRVSVTIGGSIWQTSVFPSENGSYVLPVKKTICLSFGDDHNRRGLPSRWLGSAFGRLADAGIRCRSSADLPDRVVARAAARALRVCEAPCRRSYSPS